MEIVWKKKPGFWSGSDINKSGKYLLLVLLLILLLMVVIFIAYLNDWNFKKLVVQFVPTLLMVFVQTRRSGVQRISTDGKTLFIETTRWYQSSSNVIRVTIDEIYGCEYSNFLGLKLNTRKRKYKLEDHSDGEMSTALLQYLKQFNHIKGLGESLPEYAKKHLEQKVKKFTLGFGPSEKRQWYAYWVYPIDPQGFGNELPELKDDYLQALAAILQKAEMEARGYPYPWRAGIRYVPDDMSLNALIFQDLGIQGADKLIWPSDVDWRVQWPEDLKKAFPRRNRRICGREISAGMDKYWVIASSRP